MYEYVLIGGVTDACISHNEHDERTVTIKDSSQNDNINENRGTLTTNDRSSQKCKVRGNVNKNSTLKQQIKRSRGTRKAISTYSSQLPSIRNPSRGDVFQSRFGLRFFFAMLRWPLKRIDSKILQNEMLSEFY